MVTMKKLNNKYIIKNLTPWMMDELVSFSKFTSFEILFLREQDEFYNKGLSELKKSGVIFSHHSKPLKQLFKKLKVVILFFFQNISKFSLDYNGVIGVKSIWWFMKIDMSTFSSHSKIHAQFATQAAIVSLLIKKYYNDRPEYSFTFHAYDIYFDNKWFSYLVRNCHKAFSISEFNMKYIDNKYINSDKVTLSRLGVNRNSIQRRKLKITGDFDIGLISWFIEKKGIIYLLSAMKVVKEKGHDNINLQIAGDGPLKKEFLEFVKINQLEDKVQFIGKINGRQKDEFFRSLDAFILPSVSLRNDQDGIPVVLMEAIAYGLPIISTKISGIPEICIDNYNGYLIEERNIEQIYDSIVKLFTHNDNEFSNNSLKLSKRYDIDLNSKTKISNLGWDKG